MTTNYGDPPQTNLEGDDVVIVLRPKKKDGEWTGMYDIIQSVVEPTTLAGKEAYSVAFTGLLMALLPQYLSEDEDFNDHYMEYIFAEHADLVEQLLEKHNLVKDMLQGFTGKLHWYESSY